MTASSSPEQMSKIHPGKIWYLQARSVLISFTTFLPRKLVRLYQWTVSPDHSYLGKKMYPHGYCRFHPSCSQYMHDALGKYGLLRGLGKGTYRILRCNPWSEGGVDVP